MKHHATTTLTLTGFVVVDQVRTVDIERFTRRLGRLAPATLTRSLEVLQAMFAA